MIIYDRSIYISRPRYKTHYLDMKIIKWLPIVLQDCLYILTTICHAWKADTLTNGVWRKKRVTHIINNVFISNCNSCIKHAYIRFYLHSISHFLQNIILNIYTLYYMCLAMCNLYTFWNVFSAINISGKCGWHLFATNWLTV